MFGGLQRSWLLHGKQRHVNKSTKIHDFFQLISECDLRGRQEYGTSNKNSIIRRAEKKVSLYTRSVPLWSVASSLRGITLNGGPAGRVAK